MIGFLIGTVCLIGLVKMMGRGCGYRRFGGGRWVMAHGGCHGGGCHADFDAPHGGRWGGHHHGGFEHWMLRGLFQRLDTTPGQEKVITQALGELRERGREGRDVLHATGEHAARAFRGERFDEGAMAEAFTRQDAALETMQKALFEALAKVHEALDPRQRREVAEMLERGPRAWSRWGGGPYRA